MICYKKQLDLNILIWIFYYFVCLLSLTSTFGPR